jgi:hypothetical protein
MFAVDPAVLRDRYPGKHKKQSALNARKYLGGMVTK